MVSDAGELEPGLSKIELEARFIEQEHRLIPAIRNFLARKQWPEADPRRAASYTALLWRIFSPGTAAIAGSSVLAAFTLGFSVIQTREVAKQTSIMNKQIAAEAQKSERQRQTEITEILFLASEDAASRYGPKTREAALKEYLRSVPHPDPDGFVHRLRNFRGMDLSNTQIQGLDLSSSDFTGVRWNGANVEDSDLRFSHLGGLERVDFLNVKLDGSSFGMGSHDFRISDTSLKRATLQYTKLRDLVFFRVDMREADLTETTLTDVVFSHVDLRGAQLNGLKLEGTIFFGTVNIQGAQMPDATRKMLLKHGAVEMNEADWRAQICKVKHPSCPE